MLKVTCYKCHWTWNFSNQAVQDALDSLEEGQDYYQAECPQCRRMNKVAIKQLKRALPRTRTAPDNNE